MSIDLLNLIEFGFNSILLTQHNDIAVIAMLILYHTCRSNSIFNLWNNYESKLPPHYFAQQLLALGDLLYRNEYYSLASTHCYGRYLAMHRGTEERLQDIVATMTDSEHTVALVRAMQMII